MGSPAGAHVRPRRVRLQVSRVPHARHTVVLFVQQSIFFVPYTATVPFTMASPLLLPTPLRTKMGLLPCRSCRSLL